MRSHWRTREGNTCFAKSSFRAHPSDRFRMLLRKSLSSADGTDVESRAESTVEQGELADDLCHRREMRMDIVAAAR